MKKQIFRKQVISGIAGCLGIALVAAAFIIWGLGVDKWIRYVTLAVLTSGFFGFLMYIFGGWQGFFSGAKMGVGFVALTVAGQELPAWGFGLLIVAAVAFFFVRPLIKQYKKDREKSSNKVINKKLADEIKLQESIESEIQEEENDFKRSIGFGEKSILLITSSGGMYQLIKGAGRLYFIRVGGEVSGLDISLVQPDFSDETAFIKSKKDFVIELCDITEIKCRYGRVTSPLDNCGKITIVTGSKSRSFAVLDSIKQERLKAFFSGMPLSFTDKSKKDPHTSSRSLTEEERRVLPVLKKAGLILTAAAFMAAAVFLFLPVDRITYRILSAACVLIPAVTFVLYVRYDKMFSLDDSDGRKSGKNRINIALPLLIPSVVLMIRSIYDIDIIGWESLLIWSGVIFAAALFALLKFTNDYKRKKSIAVLFIFIMLVYAPSATAQINCLYSYSAPEINTTLLLEKRISKGDHGDTYYFKVALENGNEKELKVTEEFYGMREAGEFVKVVEKSGLLGIAYAYIDEE